MNSYMPTNSSIPGGYGRQQDSESYSSIDVNARPGPNRAQFAPPIPPPFHHNHGENSAQAVDATDIVGVAFPKKLGIPMFEK